MRENSVLLELLNTNLWEYESATVTFKKGPIYWAFTTFFPFLG